MILTRAAFENAIVVTIALGGSTNAVLHLLAIAHAAGVPLELDDFTRDRRARAGAGRPATQRALFDVGTDPHRRHPAADEITARCRHAARRLPDGHRQDARPESRACEALSKRPGHGSPAHPTPQERKPPRGAVRQSRARGRGGQDHRQGGAQVHRNGACIRRRGGLAAGHPGWHGAGGRCARRSLRRARVVAQACARC